MKHPTSQPWGLPSPGGGQSKGSGVSRSPALAREETPGRAVSGRLRAVAGLARPLGCARGSTVTYPPSETASPGNPRPLAGLGHSPPRWHRGGPPGQRRGLLSHCRTAALSPQPQAGPPGARARGTGAGGGGRVSAGCKAHCQCRHRPGPHLPAAAAAPGGPEHSTGDPHRPTWRRKACPLSLSRLRPHPASLEVGQKQLLKRAPAV